MGEIVNLRRERKRAARAKAAVDAEQNRVAHGLPKAEREANAARRELTERRLEGHKREERDER